MPVPKNNLLSRVASYIQTEHLINPKDVVVVAVSGGPDSVTLLDLLHQLRISWQLTLHVAHLNHQLRPNASADANFVREIAQKYGHTFHQHTENIAKRAKTAKQSLEEAARYARREFLEKVRQQTGGHRIALGHTKSDQAETVLMRLIRGAGLTGLGGIRPLSGGCWIRPLLFIARPEIETYITNQNLDVHHDETNTDPKFLRNRIRIDLLPHLQKAYNHQIEDALARAANVLQYDDEQLEIIAEQAFSEILLYRANRKIILDVTRYFGYHISLRRRLIRLALFALQADAQATQFQAVERILEILAKTEAQIQIAPQISAHHTNRKLIIARPTSFLPHRVHPGKNTVVHELNSRLHTHITTRHNVKFEDVHQTDCSTAYFDLDQLPNQTLTLRPLQPGDWFYPFGMRGKKKVSRFLSDTKIPRILRDEIPLLVCGETILWVVGQRRAQIAPITSNTQRILQVIFSGGIQTVFT